MCGICGFTGKIDDSPAVIKQMCEIIAHRGPDGEDIFVSDQVTFGHRRLSLIDLEGGNQPMLKDDGKFAIVFNGEIYNYQDLREELIAQGWEFETHSDTEVLLVGFMAWGEAVLQKLRGMFAFAIWDGERQKLFCARDPFGIKPFYYTVQDSHFIFASEIKAILEHPCYERELNRRALDQYLCYEFNPLDETFFKGVYKLPQGHCLTVKNDEFEMERYFIADFKEDARLTMKEAPKLIDEAMKESVRYHNVADVEVGSFLSSGIDSSYMAACLAEENPAVRTFTVGFDEYGHSKGERDEVSWAAELAQTLGVANTNKRITEKEYWEVVPLVQWHMDEPCADPSAVALYFVDQLAASQVKAVLSGEGADEFFGGYKIYQAPLRSALLSWCPKPVLRMAAKALKKLGIRGANYLERASKSVDDWYYTNANGVAFTEQERERLLVGGCSAPRPQEIVRGYYQHADAWDEPTRMQFVDINCWLVGDILLKTDKMAMAHSLESRVPFLDKGVWSLARTLPTDLKVTEEETKVALREAAEFAIPKDWARKEKLGFPVPLAAWLRKEEYASLVQKWFSNSIATQFFDQDELQRLLDEHQEGKDRSRKIWIIWMFLLWYQIFFIDRSKPQNW